MCAGGTEGVKYDSKTMLNWIISVIVSTQRLSAIGFSKITHQINSSGIPLPSFKPMRDNSDKICPSFRIYFIPENVLETLSILLP